jgi:hypothetical protein
MPEFPVTSAKPFHSNLHQFMMFEDPTLFMMFEDPTLDTHVAVVNIDRICLELTEQQTPCHLQWFDKVLATALMVDVCMTKFFGCLFVCVDAHVPLLTSGKNKSF